MFKWFSRSRGQATPDGDIDCGEPEAEPAVEHQDEDENGRAVVPEFRGLKDPASATETQMLLALSWSKRWHGNHELFNEDIALGVLASCLKGEALRSNQPDREVIRMAVRALRSAGTRNRAYQVRGAFPWMQLRLGPQEDPCRKARSMSGKIISHDQYPSIPLPGCTASECRCWVRSVTTSEKAKGNG
ncbi:hypothetical protein [Cereibacter sphaeroides]|uniref:hypothetical protein n=1 Tax=Cereibacter sphaeroides TaxID=1063 RepID=UPI00140FF8F5|nr:hypothetical protein [Cereibacter sphaeroides]